MAAESHEFPAKKFSLNPDYLRLAFNKLSLGSVDWESIRIVKRDLFEKINSVRGKHYGENLNQYNHWNAIPSTPEGWDEGSRRAHDFREDLLKLIPTLFELEAFSKQEAWLFFGKVSNVNQPDWSTLQLTEMRSKYETNIDHKDDVIVTK